MLRGRLGTVLLLVLLSSLIQAQTFRGAINGTVTDPAGAMVAGAAVKATDMGTGIEHNTVTTTDGQFAFQDLPLGSYRVTVTATGFPTLAVDKVAVTAGQVYTLPIKLTMQKESTVLEVSAAALTVDTTTATQSAPATGARGRIALARRERCLRHPACSRDESMPSQPDTLRGSIRATRRTPTRAKHQPDSHGRAICTMPKSPATKFFPKTLSSERKPHDTGRGSGGFRRRLQRASSVD